MRLLIRSFTRLGGFTRSGVSRRGGFTLIELLTVMTIIAILAGLIFSIAGYVTKKGALARATAEIKAIETGCENYHADNGIYPHQPLAISGSIPAISGIGSNSNVPSDALFPAGTTPNGNSVPGTAPSTAGGAPTSPYASASLELYEALTGDLSCTGTGGGIGQNGQPVPNYIADMKPDVWGRSNMSMAVGVSNPVYFLSDPFGNSYGYSTAYNAAYNATYNATYSADIAGGMSPGQASSAAITAATVAAAAAGYNPTYDLWSTGGNVSPPNPATTSGKPGDPMLQWPTNWR